MTFILILLFAFLSSTKSEVFTALTDLEEVLQTESYLILNLENYIEAEQERLEYLQRYANFYRTHHNKAEKNVQLYVENPINAYTLIKRLTTDWKEVESLINTDLRTDYVRNITYIKENMKFPTDEDLNGAAVGLTRLQDTYKLDTSSLARGELNGKNYSSELSAADCFEMGRQSYNNGDYFYTQQWMKEADNRLKMEVNKTVRRSEILEYLDLSTSDLEADNRLKMEVNETLKENEILEDLDLITYDLESYQQLCRGEVFLSPEETLKLKCRYLKDKPFLMLAPFKVEEAHHKPDIFIFYDVLADSEIITIKRLAQPRFKTAMVLNTHTGEHEITESRIGKLAWVGDHEHKHIADLTQRVADMTGLTMETAETFQVVNYGIGGHYLPHYDIDTKTDKIVKRLETGDRIATVLFYMSDVEQGGATVFPFSEVSLWPQKGSAAFWFNLHESGDGDIMTLHAACPVLIGSKWVMTKWIHERGQEFLRPCTNERPSEDLIV